MEGKNIPFPDVIDNSPSKKSSKNIYQQLEKRIPLTMRRIGNKDIISKRLLREKRYHHLIIPFQEIQTKKDVYNFLDRYELVIIKPRGGNRGRNIYFAEREDGKYVAKQNNDVFSLNNEEFINSIVDGNYVVQKYINSTTKKGNAFDVRIHIRRGERGQWKVVKIYPRIGAEDSYTSNVSQGGSIAAIIPFLKAQFPLNYKQIKQQLDNLAKEFPVYFQKAYTKPVDAIGLDLGIDKKGEIWLFEVNSYPGSTSFELESQTEAMSYAKYLAQNKELVTQNN